MPLVRIPTILETCNPVETPPWEFCEGMVPDDVWACIMEENYHREPAIQNLDGMAIHAARIAYLHDHPADDPIQLDASLAAAGKWPIEDGNHRLYAAILRGDAFINAEISGFESDIEEIFGISFDDVEPD